MQQKWAASIVHTSKFTLRKLGLEPYNLAVQKAKAAVQKKQCGGGGVGVKRINCERLTVVSKLSTSESDCT